MNLLTWLGGPMIDYFVADAEIYEENGNDADHV